MYFITMQQSPHYHQMTMEELFSFDSGTKNPLINSNVGNTVTYERESISEHFLEKLNVQSLIDVLTVFNSETEELRNTDRVSLYKTFYTSKKTGGLRRIDAPRPELMNALRRLKLILENDFSASYHTSAFAYIKSRSTIGAVKKHRDNNSKWFGKFDLSDFFGSTTLDFLIRQLSMIYPFCEVLKLVDGRKELEKALELAFLNGGLPQGTPISPLITNVMMVPIDFSLNKALLDFERQSHVYTRYADDFIISSKHTFDVSKVESLIVEVLNKYDAPFKINSKKTRYGSSSGANWNLGVMLNKDNNITIGHKAKKRFQNMLHNYGKDKMSGKLWEKNDVQTLDGYINYYKMVEQDVIENIISHISRKLNFDIRRSIKEDLRM